MSSKRDLDSSDDEPFLAKKIKLEHKLISEKISKNHPDIDISDHEVSKFLLIFNTLLENSLAEETESTDAEGGVQDVILMVGIGLLKLLKGNIESLKLPPVLKTALKRLKSFLFLINTKTDGADKNNSENNLGSETKIKNVQVKKNRTGRSKNDST